MLKMKKLIQPVFAFGILTVFLVACSNGPSGTKLESSDSKLSAANGDGIIYTVDTANSIIEWEGAKLTYAHHGYISISEGSITMDGDEITGGKFSIDMNSIVNLDVEDEEKNAMLVGHLKSADFFETENFPMATFEITSAKKLEASSYEISGNLTLKGTSRGITFVSDVVVDGNSLSATTAQFVIDRSEWNVRYGSTSFFDDLKDDFIKNEIGLVIKLKATK